MFVCQHELSAEIIKLYLLEDSSLAKKMPEFQASLASGEAERANKLPAKSVKFRMVGIPGFEPGLQPPEDCVLPLHHIPLV